MTTLHTPNTQHTRNAPDDPSSSCTAAGLAVVPACLLPYKRQWQALANALPSGSILLCLPRARGRAHRDAWDAIVRSMCAMGHPVLVLPMERFLEYAEDVRLGAERARGADAEVSHRDR